MNLRDETSPTFQLMQSCQQSIHCILQWGDGGGLQDKVQAQDFFWAEKETFSGLLKYGAISDAFLNSKCKYSVLLPHSFLEKERGLLAAHTMPIRNTDKNDLDLFGVAFGTTIITLRWTS